MSDGYYYPHEPAKFNAKTIMLTAAEKGAYIVLINLMYMRGGPIDNDIERLPGAVGCTRQAYRKILERLLYFDKIVINSDGRLTNPKAERVMARRNEERRRRQEAGRKGAEKSAETREKLGQFQPEDSEESSVNSAENNDLVGNLLPAVPKTIDNNKTLSPSEREGARKTQGSRLSPDWRPEGDDWQMAIDLGIDAEATLPMFRDYWAGKAGKEARKADWSATWRNWCRREAERKRTNRPGPAELPLLTIVQGGSDPNDGWGIDAWCKSYPGMKAIEGEDAKPSILSKGKWAYGPPGGRKIIDHVARLVAHAAGWEKTMRPDWSLLAQWVDADINVSDIVVPNVKRLADYFRSNGQPATTLKAFDRRIREAKAAA